MYTLHSLWDYIWDIFGKISFRLIDSFTLSTITLIGKMGIRAYRTPGFSAPEIIEGGGRVHIVEEGDPRSPESSLEKTKERSRFNASNVGRDKLSKHFSRYYQVLFDLPHVLRRIFAGTPSNPLSSFLIFLLIPRVLFCKEGNKSLFRLFIYLFACFSHYRFSMIIF